MAHPRAGKPKEAAPVKFLAAVLFGRGFDTGARLFPELERILGGIDYAGPPRPFDMTDYYEDEMGPGLERVIISFERLGSAADMARIKHATADVEIKLEGDSGRVVNIDSGYLDYHKVVLASFKEGPQKIYLGEGVYADPVLIFQNGTYRPFPWSFPDFKAGLYTDDFLAIRKIYKEARRTGL